jgi:MerR family transcriptional regulator, copper efflux regulator
MSHLFRRRLAVVQDAPALPEPGAADQARASDHGRTEWDEAGLLQVGDLAKRTNKTVRAIHLYEDLGLLRPVDRSRGRFRLYNHDSVARVLWISKMQAVGFSLPELREMLDRQEQARTPREAALVLRGTYVEKLTAVQEKLAELHRLEQELLSSLTYLDACQSACNEEAHREECPACARHLDQPEPPSLVTGAHVR